jgi:branched-subunit amino acid aminotransferase/4-amino-4-deoxychorismate lyase
VNGTLYDRASLPRELAVRFGTALGISPVCYLKEHALLAQHVDVLEHAATTLGYTGFDRKAVQAAIAACDAPESAVALVPTPAEHKAGAPGHDWLVVVEPWAAPVAAMPLRASVSHHRRNHHSPISSVLLLGDAEFSAGKREAAAAGRDNVVWLNLDEAVACVGTGVLFADIGGQVVTPLRGDGVPDSGWRTAAIAQGVAAEESIPLDDLRTAASVAVLWPWGSVQPVAAIDDVGYDDPTLATRVETAIVAAAAAGRQ